MNHCVNCSSVREFNQSVVGENGDGQEAKGSGDGGGVVSRVKNFSSRRRMSRCSSSSSWPMKLKLGEMIFLLAFTCLYASIKLMSW